MSGLRADLNATALRNAAGLTALKNTRGQRSIEPVRFVAKSFKQLNKIRRIAPKSAELKLNR
jgi:hypothetical protein